MIDPAKLDKAIEALKGLKRERTQYEKLRQKEFAMSNGDHSEKQRRKVSVDVSWQAMHVDQKTHLAHVAVVEAGLADPYEDNYYGETEYNPDGWHDMKFMRRRPEIGG